MVRYILICLFLFGSATQAAEHWLRFLELSPESPWAEEARSRLHVAAPILEGSPTTNEPATWQVE